MEYYTTDYAKRKCMLYISFFIVLFFCTLRYNVGFDSEVYLSLYTKVPNSLFANDNLSNFREEYLFLKYFVLLKNIGITPPFAIAITIAIINLLFFRFIYKYSPYKCFSVLVLFSWYFTYIFSTLRQGLAMGIFLCIAYPFLEQKKYIKYYIVVLIATFFHNSTFIAFFLPLFLNTLRKASRFSIIVLFIISFVVALVPNPLLQSLATIVNQGGAYVENLGTSYVALANRVLAFGIVFFYIILKTNNTKL
jgi:hypothetical protein